VHDLRLAVRALRATPVVTAVAVLSLALGIGANTAIFSIVDSLLLRALPVERPEQLVLITTNVPGNNAWTYAVWEQIRERRHELFHTAFAFPRRPMRFNLAPGGPTDLVEGIWASGEYFDALGVPPMLGRTFTLEDDQRGGGPDGPVAVISYAFWQRRFGGAADVIGRTQIVERVPFTIVGVMPPGFFGVDVGSAFDIAVPIGTEPLIRVRDSWFDRPTTYWLQVMARLKDGHTIASAEQALRSVQPQIRAATLPPAAEWQERYLTEPFVLQSAARGASSLRGGYRQPMLAIMAVVVLVLLIACANIANLLLARTAARRHELSVRMAMGASRWRLARQLLVESLLLSGVGALLGLLFAQWGTDLLVRQLSTHASTVFLDVQLDWRVLTFTAIVAVIVAILFGVVPALRASRAEPMDAIREHGRGAAGDRRIGLGQLLVAGQVALSLVLVVVAGLFVRTFASLATLDVGFDRDPVLIARMDVQASAVEPSQRWALYERVAEAARAMPGVSYAAVSEVTPASGWVVDTYVEVEGAPGRPLSQSVSYRNTITPGWFSAYGTRLVEGRDFDARDRRGAPGVAIVNQAFVRKFLPDGPVVGRRIRNNEKSPWMEIVGVASDATYRALRAPVPPTLYTPIAQWEETWPAMSLSVRVTSGAPALLTRSVADAVGRVDRDIALTFTPLRQQVDAALVQERIIAMLSAFFGALALMLAGLGLYGVTSYAVSRRRGEIGIRMALGASARNVVRMVLGRIGTIVGLGVVVGACVSLWAARYVETLLYGVTPHDVATLATASLVLATIGALAGWLPARRAARVDPARVLREE
jgi:putative ABC transport system permease protein